MFRDFGNAAIYSTTAQPVSNPSTATLCAELDSTQLGTKNLADGQRLNCQVTWIVGGDTSATWQLESCASTALNAGVDQVFVKSPTGQSGQYITSHQLLKDYRLRARVASTFTASVVASISAEFFT